ncbi:heme NO-binding domain-containing protein [Polaribacter sp. R77954]|uniref:heme NO-binding domain-containing protein n=1 Tax=Polaribacter sp. R77954 TaxID=3093870 RepID=UPI0037C5C341
MKGIVFTEFLDLVEKKFGLEMLDKIISESQLSSKGLYSNIGTYSFAEMLQLLQNLSSNTLIPVDDLLLVYGEHFFSVLQDSYGNLLSTYKDPIEMLSSIENHIHVEVQKIFPKAELPTFIIEKKEENNLIMIYKSSRAMHHFGLGLMNKTFSHFNATANITMQKINEEGTEVRFLINKKIYP